MDFSSQSEDRSMSEQELSEQEPNVYWIQRVAGLEQIVCELLRKNCELRFALAKLQAESTPDRMTGD